MNSPTTKHISVVTDCEGNVISATDNHHKACTLAQEMVKDAWADETTIDPEVFPADTTLVLKGNRKEFGFVDDCGDNVHIATVTRVQYTYTQEGELSVYRQVMGGGAG